MHKRGWKQYSPDHDTSGLVSSTAPPRAYESNRRASREIRTPPYMGDLAREGDRNQTYIRLSIRANYPDASTRCANFRTTSQRHTMPRQYVLIRKPSVSMQENLAPRPRTGPNRGEQAKGASHTSLPHEIRFSSGKWRKMDRAPLARGPFLRQFTTSIPSFSRIDRNRVRLDYSYFFLTHTMVASCAVCV